MQKAVRSKPSTMYFKNQKSIYQCSICNKEYSQQSNCIKHIHKHDFEISNTSFSNFQYNGNYIQKQTENLLLWRCAHGIAMQAICDPLFRSLFAPHVIQSDKTNQRISNDMCTQILHMNFQKTSERYISLILDGGTVAHNKWIAIGYNYRSGEKVHFQVLDMRVFQKSTASDIKNLIDGISERIKNVYDGRVVATCRDNAANFKKAFLSINSDVDEQNPDDFIPLNILSVSCACHTAQLALKDLYSVVEGYRDLIENMKAIQSKITFLSKADFDRLKIGFYPRLQSQRWNSAYNVLCYIINHLDGISKLFQQDETFSLRIDELCQLQKELAPVYVFTCMCEPDNANQATIFIAYRALEARYQVINTFRAKKILELILVQFNTTADLELARLCFYTTNAGIREKQDKYPHISLANITSEEEARRYHEETNFLKSFREIISKVCIIVEMNFEVIFDAFQYLLQHYKPSNDNVEGFPKLIDLNETFKNYGKGEFAYVKLSQFIEILQILPASEASAERVFARMRDIHSTLQTNQTAETLRTEIILSFHAEEARKLGTIE